jgi:hypothetical protein
MYRGSRFELGKMLVFAHVLILASAAWGGNLPVFAPGDLVVSDGDSIFILEPNGQQKATVNLMADEENFFPWGVAVGVTGRIFATAPQQAAILEVDPNDTAHRVILPNVNETLSIGAFDIDVAANGDLIVPESTISEAAAVYRVNPNGGSFTTVSSSTVGTGDDLTRPLWGATDGTTYYVADTEQPWELLAVDLATGNRSVVSRDPAPEDNAEGVGTGPELGNGPNLAILSPSTLLAGAESGVVTVDVFSGDRALFFQDGVGTGPTIPGASVLVVEENGNILMALRTQLFRVDPVTLDRTVIFEANGDITGVASYVTPEPTSLCLATIGLVVFGGSIRRRRGA